MAQAAPAQPRLSELVAAANAPLTDPDRNRVIGSSSAGVRFELYHHALSLCSHQVRCALFEKAAPYISHDIGILPPVTGNYHPDDVRLRMQGRPTGNFVDGYSGRSATASEGFDRCVVPTLAQKTADAARLRVLACAQRDAAAEHAQSQLPALRKPGDELVLSMEDSLQQVTGKGSADSR